MSMNDYWQAQLPELLHRQLYTPQRCVCVLVWGGGGGRGEGEEGRGESRGREEEGGEGERVIDAFTL